MNRKKARSIIKVADGTGGLTTLTDRRFEKPAAWPVQFEVPTAQEQADRWLRYLTAECSRRGWSTGGLGELGRGENSGTVNIIGSGQALLDVVWERRRDGPLKVRARSSASSVLALPDVERLLNEITLQCGSRATERIYARGTLHYEGMAWRGELWLDGSIRLGPPSLQDETATIGPRILHVDAMLECIGQSDVPTAREQLLLEVSAFLSVVMRTAVRLPDQGRTWTWEFGVDGCEVRHLGYMEVRNPLAMPARGTDAEMPLYVGDPPNFFDGTSNEIALRADVVDLWRLYRGLTVERRFQFLQSASKWQEALIHWQDRPSLSFALMVVACEALKPSHADERLNCYHVVEALLGRSLAERLRQSNFPAQRVRSTHLHSGEFHGSELMEMAFMSSYRDPSFREAHREMFQVAPAAIVEWLKRGGALNTQLPNQRRTLLRRVKDNVLVALVAAFCLGLLVGRLWQSI